MSGDTMMEMDEVISVNPDICSGKSAFRGTRIAVQPVFEFLAADDSVEHVLEQYPSLKRSDIGAAFGVASGLTGNQCRTEPVSRSASSSTRTLVLTTHLDVQHGNLPGAGRPTRRSGTTREGSRLAKLCSNRAIWPPSHGSARRMPRIPGDDQPGADLWKTCVRKWRRFLATHSNRLVGM